MTKWRNAGYRKIAQARWNAPLEPTSSQKAARFEHAYRGAILGDTRRCLDSYAFIRGHKREATATWFGLFLTSGERINAADALQKSGTKRA